MHFCEQRVVHVAGDFRDPVVPACKDREHRTERQHVVEVGHNIVGVMQRAVDTRIGQHHARYTANGEQEDEAHGPQHRRAEGDRTAPHGGNPGEDLDPCRNRDRQRGQHEVGL